METSTIRKAIELVDDTDKFNCGVKDAAMAELSAIEAAYGMIREDNSMLLATFDAASSHMVNEQGAKRIAANAVLEHQNAMKDEALRSTITFLRMYCPTARLQWECCESALTSEPDGKALVDVENIRKIEWHQEEQGRSCPSCDYSEEDGHTSGCWLGNLLKENQ